MNSAETTFALEAYDRRAVQSAVAPMVRRCSTCRWFAWSLGPTGRRRPTEPGRCRWEPPRPKAWPYSYRKGCGGNPWREDNPPMPQPSHVYEYQGETCQVWEPNKEVSVER